MLFEMGIFSTGAFGKRCECGYDTPNSTSHVVFWFVLIPLHFDIEYWSIVNGTNCCLETTNSSSMSVYDEPSSGRICIRGL